MGRIRGETAHRLERLFESVYHLVEGRDQPAKLITGSGRGKPQGEVGGLDLVRKARHFIYGPKNPAGQPITAGPGDKEGERDQSEECPAESS